MYLKLQYKLEDEEIKEALRCLDYKKESGVRKIHLYVVSVLGAIVLCMYIKKPDQMFLFFLLCLVVLLLFYMTYGTIVKRNKMAKKMMRVTGEYYLDIRDNGLYYGDANQWISFHNNKMECIESKNVYVLKIGREIFFVPKRILIEIPWQQLEDIVVKEEGTIVRIIVEEE